MTRFLTGLSLLPVFLLSPLALPAGNALLAAPEAPQATRVAAVDRRGSTLPRYNFPSATRGDRFARRGLSMKVGVRGWTRYQKLIKRVAYEHQIDPYVLGAYIWVESEFDERQDYTRGPHRAIGLGSVQAQYNKRYTVPQLMDPYLNLTLTAKEFSEKWDPDDMSGTVMDVWYPAWRRLKAKGEKIPVIKTPRVYVQAIANRYYALQEIDQRLKRGRPAGVKDRLPAFPISRAL
ncbi:MAG: hypothetical protein ACLGIN_18715 [Candidatus Sericytochromatia bacterium]